MKRPAGKLDEKGERYKRQTNQQIHERWHKHVIEKIAIECDVSYILYHVGSALRWFFAQRWSMDYIEPRDHVWWDNRLLYLRVRSPYIQSLMHGVILDRFVLSRTIDDHERAIT